MEKVNRLRDGWVCNDCGFVWAYKVCYVFMEYGGVMPDISGSGFGGKWLRVPRGCLGIFSEVRL